MRETGEKGAFDVPKSSNLELHTSNLPVSRLDRVETPAVSCQNVMKEERYAV
jgi:hypothetical protein